MSIGRFFRLGTLRGAGKQSHTPTVNRLARTDAMSIAGGFVNAGSIRCKSLLQIPLGSYIFNYSLELYIMKQRLMSMGPKQALFGEFATVARALGHPHRLEILEHLAQGERAVEMLSERAGLSIANTSQHLQQLRRAGLVIPRRDGKFVFYRLADENILDLLTTLRQVAERNLAEVDRIVRGYFAERDSMEPVSRKELLDRLRDGLVTVLDVRPPDEFAMGHLPGAINIPAGDLETRLTEFDRDQEIVAYCRGAYCVLSFEVVAALRARGFKVRRLEEGFPEWRAAGLPLEYA